MQPNFTGPSYTIGIEEELMIVDAESYALVNAIESLLGDAPDGEIKPELHESVLDEWSFVQTLRHLAFASEERRRLDGKVVQAHVQSLERRE